MSSKDLKLFNTCDHKVVDEVLTISAGPPITATLAYISNKNISNMSVYKKYDETKITCWSLGVDGQTITFTSGCVATDTNVYPQPIYLCDYVASPGSCPKCKDAVMQDVRYDNVGSLDYVSDSEKLRQLVKKAIITGMANNTFHEQYGTYLMQLSGAKLTPQLVMKINSTLDNMSAYLKKGQEEQFNLNNYEILYDISDVNLKNIDERTLGINMTILNREYYEISTYVEIVL